MNESFNVGQATPAVPEKSAVGDGVPVAFRNNTGWAYRNLIANDQEWTPIRKPRAVTASANVNALDDEIRADCTAGAVVMTLETAVGCDGRMHTLKKIDSSGNAASFATTGGQTIDGAATSSLAAQYGAVTVISNGANWDVKAQGGSSGAAASQAEMEAATSTTVFSTPGRQQFHPGHPKAWGLITPNTTVTASYPSAGTSVSRASAGVYTVTHGITFSSTSVAAIVAGYKSPDVIIAVVDSIPNATTVKIRFFDITGSPADPDKFSYALFGDI